MPPGVLFTLVTFWLVMPEDTTGLMEFDEASALILDATHTGDLNFVVDLLNIETDSSDILINGIGDFDGRIVTHVEPGKYVLNITYASDYSLDPISISLDEVQEPPLSRDGEYFEVIPVSLNSPVRMEISKHNDASFHQHMGVTLYDTKGNHFDTLINDTSMEATDHAVTISTQADMYLSIEYYGSWSLSLTEL